MCTDSFKLLSGQGVTETDRWTDRQTNTNTHIHRAKNGVGHYSETWFTLSDNKFKNDLWSKQDARCPEVSIYMQGYSISQTDRDFTWPFASWNHYANLTTWHNLHLPWAGYFVIQHIKLGSVQVFAISWTHQDLKFYCSVTMNILIWRYMKNNTRDAVHLIIHLFDIDSLYIEWTHDGSLGQ